MNLLTSDNTLILKQGLQITALVTTTIFTFLPIEAGSESEEDYFSIFASNKANDESSNTEQTTSTIFHWQSTAADPKYSEDAVLHSALLNNGPPPKYTIFWYEPNQLMPSDGVVTNTQYCHQTDESLSDIMALAEREFARLELSGTGITLEPDRDEYIIRLPVIVLTNPESRTLTTELLGVPVQMRAKPGWFEWNWGDGSEPLVTNDPGASYPDHTISHTYETLGTFTISLTTTWLGEFSLDGGASWIPIQGTVNTINTSRPFVVGEQVPLLTG